MKKILFLFALLSSISISAQFTTTGIVIDKSLNQPLDNVTVMDTISKQEVVTRMDGTFRIETNGILKFSKKGYQTLFLSVTQNQQFTAYLIPDTALALDEVLINAPSIPIPYKEATDAVSLVTTSDINRGNTLELHPILNRVPGVFMQSATLNTNRIAIRGIGARNLFGTANIRAYFGDIPLTDGNGESSIEDLELGALSGIEIHKGPSASSYGVGLGGVILLHPQYSTTDTPEGQIEFTTGSFGLRRIVAKTSVNTNTANLNVLFSNNHSDGYRDNNEYNRNTLTLTSQIDLGDKDLLSILGSYVDLEAGIPSSLDQEDFDNNPRQAAFTWGRSQAFEDVNYGILGVTWKHDYTASLSHNTSVFTSFRDNYEPRPFNILEEQSTTVGIRTRVLGADPSKKNTISWTAGAELFYDTYNGKTFQNLFEDFPVGTGSVQGDLLSDLDEKRYFYNLFAEVNYQPIEKLRINVGAHLNQTFFDIDDKFLQDGEDNSGDFDFDPIFSPKLGVNYEIQPELIFFGNIAHGFSTPTTAETLLPDGIFNPDIKPEIGWNYEVGMRYKLLNRLQGSVSFYTLRVRDLLVSRRTVEDNFFAINAGKTTHNGIDAELRYQLLQKQSHQLHFFANVSIYDHTFDDFVDLDNDFSGNDVTGIPSEVINAGLDLTSPKGFYGNISYQIVGEIPANDANTVSGERYDLLHGKIGYKNNLGNRLSYNFSFGVNNILDTKYASQLQINARGFGGNQPRFFYPGLPINVFGGININYRL
ncbi:TonB-dependent receptor domain-containing protein [Aquimarina spongiae]|uniref:Iron complex outermembrane recepter protein n=1 Tax=Aquimarina spongiae TaxID=570521 RepID=A0A1M6CXX0_9FLAO|nr:TonB-dependent receptor [Aquimarina spongiae]SHI65723.1 iron complex outermembrane recepter protein [Aquimarina spongiae]